MCFRKKRKLTTKSESLVKKGDTYFIDDIKLSLDELRNGTVISWASDDTDFEIIFPNDRRPVRAGGFFNRNSKKSRGRKVYWKLDRMFANIIENELKKGVNEVKLYYAIYCNENKSMAEGNSFPKMIIK